MFTLLVAANQAITLTTVSTGQHGSYHDPPEPKPFPRPYLDEFNGKSTSLRIAVIFSTMYKFFFERQWLATV